MLFCFVLSRRQKDWGRQARMNLIYSFAFSFSRTDAGFCIHTHTRELNSDLHSRSKMVGTMQTAPRKAPQAKKTATTKSPKRQTSTSTSTSTGEGGVKRERSSTPKSSTTTSATTAKKPRTTTSSSKVKSEGDHPSPGKSAPRLPGSAKQKIAEEIIAIGAGGLNVEKMAAAVSLFGSPTWDPGREEGGLTRIDWIDCSASQVAAGG